MTTIKLNFINRVKLTGILSAARGGEGGFDKLHALLKVYEAVRFTEAELAQLKVTDLGGGTVNYQIIDTESSVTDFGAKDVAIEDQQAKWLARELDAWVASATIDDLSWLTPLRESLQAPPKKGKK